MLYVANVEEGEAHPPADLVAYAKGRDAKCVAASARIEAELAELPAAEAIEMRAELGLTSSGLDRLVDAAYELLDLVGCGGCAPNESGWKGSRCHGTERYEGANARERPVHSGLRGRGTLKEW